MFDDSGQGGPDADGFERMKDLRLSPVENWSN